MFHLYGSLMKALVIQTRSHERARGSLSRRSTDPIFFLRIGDGGAGSVAGEASLELKYLFFREGAGGCTLGSVPHRRACSCCVRASARPDPAACSLTECPHRGRHQPPHNRELLQPLFIRRQLSPKDIFEVLQ